MILTGKGKIAGVIGWPVSHSRSPALHRYWIDRYGVDGAYVPLAVAPGRLPTALQGLAALGFRGANVTVPYKEGVVQQCKRLTERAAAIGAVNTLVVEKDGLVGDNTDGFGFMASLEEGVPDWQVAGKHCLVLGAGGAARAVAWSLIQAGAGDVVITNRSPGRAEALAGDLKALTCAWTDRAVVLADMDLVVNTTTLGMQGQPPLELDLGVLPKSAVVTDLVYAPLETPLLAAARARGNRVVDGLGMLLHQARPGFAAWYEVEAEVDAGLREAVLSVSD